jgi:N-acetyl-alpha-D-muramate 1-phosphate uridylyltransferase
LRSALPLLGEEFFVIYGDSYLDVAVEPIYSVYIASGAPALMTVFHNQNRWGASNVIFDGRRVLRHQKAQAEGEQMDWIDFGLSVFRRQVIASWLAPEPCDLSELTGSLAARGLLAGFAVARRFYEIGTAEGLAATEHYLREKAASQPIGRGSIIAANQ